DGGRRICEPAVGGEGTCRRPCCDRADRGERHSEGAGLDSVTETRLDPASMRVTSSRLSSGWSYDYGVDSGQRVVGPKDMSVLRKRVDDVVGDGDARRGVTVHCDSDRLSAA